MHPSKAQKKWAKRCRLFFEQAGRCHWCQCDMVLMLRPPSGKAARQLNLATFEHLDDRLSPERGQHPGERRIVLACWECNNDRAHVTLMALPIEKRRELCAHPTAKNL